MNQHKSWKEKLFIYKNWLDIYMNVYADAMMHYEGEREKVRLLVHQKRIILPVFDALISIA